MKLVLRGKFWWYRFEAGGREYYHSTKCLKTDKATARKVAESAYSEVVLGRRGIRSAPTLKGAAEGWLASHGKTKSAAHRRAALQSLNSLQDLHDLTIVQLSPGVIAAWSAGYLQDHAQSSLNTVLRYLKLWLNWAKGEGYLQDMPCKIKESRPQERVRPIVSVDQIQAFMAACDRINPQIQAALHCALMLGLRESELLAMRWEWLSDVYTVTGKTKSKRNRAIPVPQPVWTAIGWMLLRQAKSGPAPRPTLGIIFPGKEGKPHSQGWLRQALRRGAASLGIPIIGMHRLRASFVTLHGRAKHHPREIQAMAGHADIRTTMAYYEPDLKQQAQAQDSLWRLA